MRNISPLRFKKAKQEKKERKSQAEQGTNLKKSDEQLMYRNRMQLKDEKYLKDMILEGVRSGKTATEIQYDLIRMKRLGDRIKKIICQKIGKSYRQKIDEFNCKIARLAEHFDIPKIGPG